MDEIHLKRLLEENILRVERENWEQIYKESQEENAKVSERILRESQRKIGNVVIKQKFKSSKFKKPLDSIIQPNEELTKQSTCDDRLFDIQHIHFLNHYKSQLQQQQWELQKRRSAYAIPLSLPSQKDVCSGVKNIPENNKKETNKENNNLLHIVSKEGAKKLTIQKLPSISIYNKSYKENSNISFEEITEYDEDTGCKMTEFQDDSTKIPPPFQRHKIVTDSLLSKRNENMRVHHPERSVFAEVNNSQTHIDKTYLKTLVREVLEDSKSPPGSQLFSKPSTENMCSFKMNPYQNSNCQSFEKKEQNCSCHINARNTLHTQTEEVPIHSTFSQTDCTSPNKLKVDSPSLRNLIHEVISEYHALSPAVSDVNSIHRETHNSTVSQKEEKTVQVSFPILEGNSTTQMSKETQVSMFVENYNSHTLIQEEKIDNSGCKKMNENKSENESLNCSLEQQLAAVTSKVENLMNVFNNHVMKSESFAENKPLNNSSNNERPIHTRDVSLQFSPYLINRSVHTSPIRTLEKANQCTNYLESNQTKKQFLSVSTQAAAAASQSEAEIKKSATVATQSDCAVTIDNWMQTLEVPEHSNNSSVSVTPVSDSPFLDDILSEGEIPFHLKFLSFHDRAANLNSTVAESSEEKDYSLSEGEIHPQYLQSSYNFPVSTDHFNKGAHSFTTLSQLKSPTEKTLNFVDSSTSEASLSRLGQNARQINFSTPIWNPENSPQLHSSGEIPSHCFSSSKRSFHDVRQMEKPFDGMKKAGISVKDSNNYYHYRTAYQMPDKNISPSNLSSLSSLDNSN